MTACTDSKGLRGTGSPPVAGSGSPAPARMIGEAKTGSQALGGIAAIRSAAYHVPRAAAYAINTWMLNPSEGRLDSDPEILEMAL